jgi:hypothetical protein
MLFCPSKRHACHSLKISTTPGVEVNALLQNSAQHLFNTRTLPDLTKRQGGWSDRPGAAGGKPVDIAPDARCSPIDFWSPVCSALLTFDFQYRFPRPNVLCCLKVVSNHGADHARLVSASACPLPMSLRTPAQTSRTSLMHCNSYHLPCSFFIRPCSGLFTCENHAGTARSAARLLGVEGSQREDPWTELLW